VGELPLQTRTYTLLLVLVTGAAFAILWSRSGRYFDQAHLATAGILLVLILGAELLDVSFPHSVITFHVSVSAAFCFAAGLTVGPLLGGAVVALAHFIDGLYVRREMIKTVVNSAGLGLSTIVSGLLYLQLADPERSTLGSVQNLLAAIVAATTYTLVNTGSLALIVAPVMGVGTFQMWRANFSGLYVELLTLATLGSLIPVLVRENPLAIVMLVVPLMIGPHLAFKGIRQAHHETRVAMEGLADALERRDPSTFRHSIRVSEYARMMLNMMPQIPRPTAEAIVAAAHVHDLGKVGAQDGSLKKPGALTEDERRELQQHAAVGAEIVDRLEAYRPSVAVIRHHHERWDGSGYPDGLAGERIPLGARIIGVADAFDAMTSDRVYRPAMPADVAFGELRKGMGTQFDPQIVELFQAAFEAQAQTSRGPTDADPVPQVDGHRGGLIGRFGFLRLVPRRSFLASIASFALHRMPSVRQTAQDDGQDDGGDGQGGQRHTDAQDLLQDWSGESANQPTGAERQEKDGKESPVEGLGNGMLEIREADDLIVVGSKSSDD
jgi:HD-GYP domain-containing protein (c-di-GMP phosphodiesterase class II)